MSHRVALIHAVTVAIAPVQTAFRELWPTAACMSLLDDSLSPDRERDGVLTPAMRGRIQALADYAISTGCEGILYTCSAFGEAIDDVAATATIPVLKPNEAMFDAALDAGDRIGMVATFEPSVSSMRQEFEEMATQRGRQSARIEITCVPAAMAALRTGDDQTHNRLVAQAATQLADCDVILLAHFSTSRAAAAVETALGRAALTSPGSAVTKLRTLIGA